MHKPSGFRDYLIAVLTGLLVLVALGSYTYFQRGFLFAAPGGAGALYVPNKVIGDAAVVLIALVFLVGPTARYFNRFDTWLNYRKELGIVAGVLAAAHGIISLWLVPARFTPEKLFLSARFPVAFAGLVGALLLVFLIAISSQLMIKKIGPARWWFFQRWGLRLVVLATLLHVILMRWASWSSWFETGAKQTPELLNPWAAPVSLLVMLFLVWVVLIRLYEAIFLYRDFGFRTKEIASSPTLLANGRAFYTTTLCLLITAYLLVLLRWAL